MKVRGHCLVWDHNNPEWLVQGKFTPDQLSHLLHEHITTVMKHYAGQVFAWDVVNEALDEKGRVKNSPWYNQPGIGFSEKGSAYIEQAFRWAHEADSKALLFYNETQGEGLNPKSDAVYAMVKDFKHRGVPIDGVGLQLHISQLDLDTAAIAANIMRLTALGVQVHITELDVSLPLDPTAPRFKPGDSPTDTPGSDRTLTVREARRFPSTAPTSPSPPTTPCWRRYPGKSSDCSEAGLLFRQRLLFGSSNKPATSRVATGSEDPIPHDSPTVPHIPV
jgi:hypothetical protein